jgi:lysophospholipase L1-like esterase
VKKLAIENARTAYNATVAAVATANTARVALADVNASFAALTTAGATIGNNITLTPNINPPTGIYSEDGIHPNTRGYAFMANIFIDAINAKFGATIPKANYAMYSATGLPIP